MIKKAELRLDVCASLNDDTPIPSYLTLSCGEPDKDNFIDYSVTVSINKEQLTEIFKILNKPKFEDSIYGIPLDKLNEALDCADAIREDLRKRNKQSRN